MLKGSNYYYNRLLDENNFLVGIYLRISKEDKIKRNIDSESISNQRDYIVKYVNEQGWKIHQIYIDDGYTGGNFERPAFKKLFSDIQNKLVNLVITKDLSRFGRDDIETGQYLRKYFPENEIRYISLNDGVDSFDNSTLSMISFKLAYNDIYLSDISNKIRATFDIKREMGKFIGAFAPYGYKKDSNDRNKFVIDENAAPIVKRIFKMYLNGVSMQQIMRTLNEEGIKSPCGYKSSNSNYKNVNVKLYKWRAESIKRMLTNPSYIGNMTQGRQVKVNYKCNKFIKIPREYWIIKENTHEPIIDKDTFEIIQKMLSCKSYGTITDKVNHLLSGLLICGDCGCNITYRREKNKRMITLCSAYSKFHECSRHAMYENDVIQSVVNELKNISKQVLVNKEKFINNLNKPNMANPNVEIEKNIKKINFRINEIKNIIKIAYEDKIKGIIVEEDFIDMTSNYNKEKVELNNKLQMLHQEINLNENNKINNTNFYKVLEKITDFEIIDKSIFMQLINKIEIFKNKEINIHYNFSKP